MADLTVRLELSFGTRTLRLIMTAMMAALAATEVASENVTLTTYYPAPSGVYTQMITTNNTYLVRDGLVNNAGQLFVGRNPGANNHMVDIYSYKAVAGQINSAIRAQAPAAVGAAEFAAITTRQNSAGVWQWAAVYGKQGAGAYAGNFVGEVRATGNIKSEVRSNLLGGPGPCRLIDTQTGVTCNPGREYITSATGFYAETITLPFYDFHNNAINGRLYQDALCCPCPVSSGCTF